MSNQKTKPMDIHLIIVKHIFIQHPWAYNEENVIHKIALSFISDPHPVFG